MNMMQNVVFASAPSSQSSLATKRGSRLKTRMAIGVVVNLSVQDNLK